MAVAALVSFRSLVLPKLLKPNLPAKRIGRMEAALGILWVTGLALGYHYDF